VLLPWPWCKRRTPRKPVAEERLRELERRFKESGAEQDELDWLREEIRFRGTLGWEHYSRLAELSVETAVDHLTARVERGELGQEELELAAYCGHAPARRILGEAAPSVPEAPGAWLEGAPKVGRPPRTTPLVRYGLVQLILTGPAGEIPGIVPAVGVPLLEALASGARPRRGLGEPIKAAIQKLHKHGPAWARGDRSLLPEAMSLLLAAMGHYLEYAYRLAGLPEGEEVSTFKQLRDLVERACLASTP
jgi:hypothetical protein